MNLALAGSSVAHGGCVSRLLSEGGTDGSGSSDDDDTVGTATNTTGTTSAPSTSTTTSSTGNTTGQPHDGPPQLIDVRLLDDATVELYFSEPLAPTDAIDPAKFRLSAAGSTLGDYNGTFYQDLGQFGGGEECFEYCWCDGYDCDTDGYCYEYCYTIPGPPVAVIGIGPAGSYSDRLLLSLDVPISPNACREIERMSEYLENTAIYLHYTSSGAPVIRDTDGEPLASIAEQWVLATGAADYRPGTFPEMDPFIPIPCPF